MKPVRIPAFAGMNNRWPDFANRQGNDHFLRTAANVDLTQVGTVRRRKGTTVSIAATDGHSLFTDGQDAFFVDYDVLKRVDTLALTAATILSGLTPQLRMSYAPLGGREFVASNGVVLKHLSLSGVRDFTLPLPATTPILSVAATGTLDAGRYQVAVAYVESDGRESGTTRPVVIDVPANGRLTISGLDSSGTYGEMVIFMSPVNGDQLFYVATATSSSHVISVMPSLGRRPAALLLAPMPPGNFVAVNNGRLFVASGNVLYFSPPYQYAHYNPLRDYIPFQEDITMVLPCGDGVYVSADQTYFLAGDPSTAKLDVALPYKAIAGAAGEIPEAEEVWWMSERGVVRANASGQAKNLQEKNVAVNPGRSGAVLYREQDGVKQMIASVFGPQTSVAAAGSWMEAEIVRGGIDL
jgi:hypothetical protein